MKIPGAGHYTNRVYLILIFPINLIVDIINNFFGHFLFSDFYYFQHRKIRSLFLFL